MTTIEKLQEKEERLKKVVNRYFMVDVVLVIVLILTAIYQKTVSIIILIVFMAVSIIGLSKESELNKTRDTIKLIKEKEKEYKNG